MHELSLCQNLIQQVEQIAREHRALRVERIMLKIGPLAGIEKSLLQHVYPFAARDTLSAGALLEIDTIPVMISCQNCGASCEVLPNQLGCSICGNFQTKLISGDELLLTQLDLTLPDSEEQAVSSAHVE